MKQRRADKAANVRKLTKNGVSSKYIEKVIGVQYPGKLITQSGTRRSRSEYAIIAREIKHLLPATYGKIASYYRLAIQRNAGDIGKIFKGIKAILYI